MSSRLARVGYGWIVRMHPAAFQERFGAEMVWIFEEECLADGAGRLMVDGLRSLVRQRCRWEKKAQTEVVGGFVLISDEPVVGAYRLMQAGLMVSAVLAVLMLLVSPHSPFSKAIRWPGSVGHGLLSLPGASPVKGVVDRSR